MKVVVAGASGLIGTNLVPALHAAGHEVVRLVRREVRAGDEIAWDPAAGSLDPSLLVGTEAVITLSGATIGRRWTAARKREILDSRVDTTSLLARTIASLDPRPSVLVCAGGVGIYGDRGDEILTEGSALGSGFLADVGRAWEAAAAPARAAGIRVVNFRQGIVLAREGGALERLLTPFRLGVGGRVGSGRQWWSWVSLHDMVSAYRFVLGADLDGPVDLASPNPAMNTQFTKALGRALGRPTIFPVPEVAVRTVFGEMGKEVLLGSQRALPTRLLDAGFAFSDPELDAAFSRIFEPERA
jgi:uncharacterized protein (TIGR01777 family)